MKAHIKERERMKNLKNKLAEIFSQLDKALESYCEVKR